MTTAVKSNQQEQPVRSAYTNGLPELLAWEDERLSHSYVLPDAALAETSLSELV